MRAFFMVVIVLGILSCGDEELVGHWHFDEDTITNNFIKSAPFLDFINDSIVEIGKVKGTYYNLERTMRIGPSCFGFFCSYKIQKDKLTLFDSTTILGIATKCEESCCDQQKDFFTYEHVEIDLPSHEKHLDSIKFTKSYQKSFVWPIHIGNAKDDKSKPSNDLSINDEINYFDLDIQYEKQKIIIPDRQRSKMHLVVYADKQTRISKIDSIFQYTCQYVDRISIALRNNYGKEKLEIRNLRINDGDFGKGDKDMPLETWIESLPQNPKWIHHQ